MRRNDNLVIMYIYLAVGSGIFGVIILIGLLFACQYLGVDLSQNWWLLAIPPFSAVALNVCLIELWGKYRKK